VGALAHVSQRTVSELELGRADRLSLRAIDRIASALEIDIRLDPWWRGGELDRLLDREHATVVNVVVKRLRSTGWQIRVEYGFNHFGERGSVDVLAWRANARAVLVVEVKTRIADIQAMLATFDRKARIVPSDLAEREGWSDVVVGRLLVVIGRAANRDVVEDHAAIFDVAFPERAVEVRRWLREPAGRLAAIWFVPPSSVAAGKHARRASSRPRTGQAAAVRARIGASSGRAGLPSRGRSC